MPPEGTPPRVPAFDRVALALARLAATCVANSRVAASSSGHALSTYRPSTPPRLRSGGVSSNDDDSGLSVTLVAPPAAAPTPQSRSGSSSSAGSPRARSAEFFAGDKKAAGSSPSLHSVAGIDASDAGGGGGGGALLAPAASATSLAKATHAAGVVGADAERPVASVALSAICGVEKKNPPFSPSPPPSPSSPSLAAFDSKRAEGKEGSSLGERSMRRRVAMGSRYTLAVAASASHGRNLRKASVHGTVTQSSPALVARRSAPARSTPGGGASERSFATPGPDAPLPKARTPRTAATAFAASIRSVKPP